VDPATEISRAQARRWRLSTHLLGGRAPTAELSPVDVVDRAVALQGQDLGSVLRAIAIRCAPGTTVADVCASFDRGELIRSWPMRGTLFATTPGHGATLLALTGERVHRSTARRRAQLGLDDAVIDRAREAAGAALEDRPRTRADMMQVLGAAGLATSGGRGYHLLFHLAVDGLLHWGRFTPDGREQMLELTVRSPTAGMPSPDEALADIARRFVESRGPVTEADLAWWTKLPVTQVRRALAAAAGLARVRVGDATCWVSEEALSSPAAPSDAPLDRIDLVPAFDEWILGYADRSLVAPPEHLASLVPGSNGVFRPAILVDGRVVGTWRVARAGRSRGAVQTELLEPVPATIDRLIGRAAAAWPHG